MLSSMAWKVIKGLEFLPLMKGELKQDRKSYDGSLPWDEIYWKWLVLWVCCHRYRWWEDGAGGGLRLTSHLPVFPFPPVPVMRGTGYRKEAIGASLGPPLWTTGNQRTLGCSSLSCSRRSPQSIPDSSPSSTCRPERTFSLHWHHAMRSMSNVH